MEQRRGGPRGRPGPEQEAGSGEQGAGSAASRGHSSTLRTPHSALITPLSLRHELARKSLHLSSAVVPVAYAAGAPRGVLLAVLGALLVVAVLVELARARAAHAPRPTLHAPRSPVELVRARAADVSLAFDRATGTLLRAHERERWSGATWMLLAFTLVIWLAPAPAAIAATWAVAVGDAAAAIVGRWLGRRRTGRAGKSLEGSLACFVATTLGAVFVAGLAPAVALAAGIAAAAAERPAAPLDDNLRVAAAVALTVIAAGSFLAAA